MLAGPNQPVVVQLIVYGINSALKNLGQTLVLREFPRNPRRNSIQTLARDINGGRIKQLFILGGDPVYNAQRGLAQDRETNLPLDWVDLQKKVPQIVRLGYYEDSTSAVSQWHVPAAEFRLTAKESALKARVFSSKRSFKYSGTERALDP